MFASTSSSLATRTNLRRLLRLRLVMTVVLGAAAAIAMLYYDVALPMHTVVGAMLLMLMLNGMTWWRLRHPMPVSDIELLMQLLLDMGVLSVLFYKAGGYTNPFVWMYLLPLIVAAVALPSRFVWLVASLAIACYSGLMFWYQPLPSTMPTMMPGMDMSQMDMDMHMMHMHASQSGFSVHLVGMWAGFVVSASVIAIFVERMARSLREYDRLMAEAREQALESERMLALGALAAGAAHELGTPLATMAVVTEELRQTHTDNAELTESLELLRKEITRCKGILSSLSGSAGELRAEAGLSRPLDAFLQDTFSRWQDMRPAIPLALDQQGSTPAPQIVADRALSQAICNLLDNAGDASPDGISVHARWRADWLELQIVDNGPGLNSVAQARLGEPGFTTKAAVHLESSMHTSADRESVGGLGLGVFLAKSVIERLGGSLQFSNREQGGTLTSVSLPLRRLSHE
jgi:two-component system sensor histidine kinase RegB